MSRTSDSIVGWSLAILCFCLAIMVFIITSVVVWKVVVSL